MRRSVQAFFATVCVAAAIAQTPGPEQLEILRNLTPEQQQALLEGMANPSPAAVPQPAGQSPRTPAPVIDNERRRASDERLAEPAIPQLRAQDSVLVQAAVPPDDEGERGALEQTRLERLVDLIGSGNPYQLDRDGRLNLPGFAPIALSGLNEKQASQRLTYEPALLDLDVSLTLLPLAKSGVAGLKPFGYDLFDNAPAVFSPMIDAPVPADYVIGPGDRFQVQLFGSQNRNLPLPVSREGVINFPELGPIPVAGLSFDAARERIESRVGQQMIGVQAAVSMGQTRSIWIFVSGDARRPGSYAVDGLATITSALYASGGINEIGSLRDIRLVRQGEIVRRFDLYDLLVRGNTSDDAKLLPGDVILIPPVGPTVSVDGEVKRPAIYELRGEDSVADVIGLAGGLTPEADRARVSLTQVDVSGRRVFDVDLGQPSSASRTVADGAILRVARLRPQIDAGVELAGHVHRPGPTAWREGLRLTDVIGSIDELRPNADQHYVLVRRESGIDRRISPVSADLVAALAAPGSDADIQLMPRDTIYVFDLAPGRERIIRPLIDELRLQSELARPTQIVQVGGRVKVPGEYPLEAGMRVSDLLRAGGNLDPAAYGAVAELTRYVVAGDGARRTELINIDLAAVRRGDVAADIALQPSDYLIVRETPDWTEQESVTLRGEVRLPGTYAIRKGETLRQVIDRAGGLTSLASAEANVFTRQDLRELEQEIIDKAAERMRSDLAALALQAANAGQAASADLLEGQAMVSVLQGTKATGRFVIDLPGLLQRETGSAKDVILRDGDELIVHKRRQEVSVIGEVQNSASFLYQPDLSRDDYLQLSGGTTRKADKRLIYVVRADGSVASQPGSWFARNYDVAIKAGDTIVVPMNTERMPRLPFWQAVTGILYNVAVSVAAINSF